MFICFSYTDALASSLKVGQSCAYGDPYGNQSNTSLIAAFYSYYCSFADKVYKTHSVFEFFKEPSAFS